MPNLVQSLFRVDPTEGLVQYVKDVKPYHSKILDILVEYVYKENVTTTVTENWNWNIGLYNTDRQLIRECGWGWNWDLVPTADSILTSRILGAYTDSTQQNYFLIEPSTSTQVVGDQIIAVTTGTGGSWTLSGNVTSHYIPGHVFAVSGNSDSASNTYYTVSSATYNGANTVVVVTGVPATATATGIVPYSTLKDYSFIVTNEQAGHLSMVTPYAIAAVDPGARSWTTSLPIATTLTAGSVVYVSDNTVVSGQNSNGKYTVVSTLPAGTGTQVFVQEYITPLAVGNGNLSVTLAPELCPSWPTGTSISVSANTGLLPTPLTISGQYYFAPTDVTGTFAIGNVRYPLEWEDYIHLTSLGTGVFTVKRTELFLPGAYVHVMASVSPANNQTYGVVSTVRDGNNYRVYVRERIPVATPAGVQFDGILTQQQPTSPGYMPVSGWDNLLCPPAQASDLFTDTTIRETFSLEWTISLSDYMVTGVTENNAPAFDFTTTNIVPSFTMSPTGFDIQKFDVGGMSDSISNI